MFDSLSSFGRNLAGGVLVITMSAKKVSERKRYYKTQCRLYKCRQSLRQCAAVGQRHLRCYALPQEECVTYAYKRYPISIGENKETLYRKALDGMLRDWYVGNVRHLNPHGILKNKFLFVDLSISTFHKKCPGCSLLSCCVLRTFVREKVTSKVRIMPFFDCKLPIFTQKSLLFNHKMIKKR